MHVIFFWRETRRLCNAVGVAGSSPTGEPYEKQQQNQGRLLQEQRLEQQRPRHQLQEERTSSLVLVQELEQALVLELALDQGVGAGVGSGSGVGVGSGSGVVPGMRTN